MSRWFANLTGREKVLIAGAAPLAFGLAVYQFAWMPLQVSRAEHVSEIAAYRMVTKIAARQADAPVVLAASPPAVPIATRVTQSAENAGLQLRRLEPEGTSLRVTLDDEEFSTIILWISDMDVNQGVRVAAFEVDRRPEPGVVSARLLLEDAR